MKISAIFFASVATLGLIGFSGCQQQPEPPAATTPSDSAEDSDHVHVEGEEHDHGDADHQVAGHAHGAGPHDGVVADWGGGKYHVEFTVDHDKTQATVYVLGADEKTPAPIAAETIELNIVDPAMIVTLEAAPQESDPSGTASRFIGTHDNLGVIQEYEGTMTGVVDGTPYSGDFKEEAHDHE